MVGSDSPRSVLVSLFLLGLIQSCVGYRTFGFDIHHKFSEPVKGILGYDEPVPEKGSLNYYKALFHGDILTRGRHLAASGGGDQKSPLVFYPTNDTFQLGGPFGYLHYANISVGTPSSSYLVALDTGSDLFWLPCDCASGGCVRGIRLSNQEVIEFSIYSPNTSTTSKKVPCNSTLCTHRRRCASESSDCPYQIVYLSNGTSSTGILVEDVLHLTTEDSKLENVEAPITFGCGRVQTGTFLQGAAPNGLIGLGMEDVAVPSILARGGYTSNSFSMCFGPDGQGRIRFGDNGSSDQEETQFNLGQSHPTYNVTITQITIGGTTADLEFNAIYDSGTSFTYLNDPAYTQITESFNLRMKEERYSNGSDIPFEYCYNLSPNQTSFLHPKMNLTMKGGAHYAVHDPLILVSLDGTEMYCLAVVKSGDINIIGQNFMTGHRVIFDREKLVLGWKPSNCYDEEETTVLPINPSDSPAITPASSVDPEATAGSGNKTVISSNPVPGNHSTKLNSLSFALIMLILFPFFVIV